MASSIQRNHAFIYDRKFPRNAHYNRSYDASFVLMCKNDEVVARNLGPKCKRAKTCIWVPKSYVTNLVGPNKSWAPKTQA